MSLQCRCRGHVSKQKTETLRVDKAIYPSERQIISLTLFSSIAIVENRVFVVDEAAGHRRNTVIIIIIIIFSAR